MDYPSLGKLASHPALIGPDHVVPTEVVIDRDVMDDYVAESIRDIPSALEVVAGVAASMTCWKSGYRIVEVTDIEDTGDGVIVSVKVTGW